MAGRSRSSTSALNRLWSCSDLGKARLPKMNLRTLLALANPCLWLGCWIMCGAAVYGDDSLSVIPSNVELTGPNSRQQLVLERTTGQDMSGQVTNATFVSLNTKVVVVQGGV